MKEDILKRAMFSMPLSKEARNSGILDGFEDDDYEDDSDMEELQPMARTPQNPEILMNNLRGDIRSVDARYMELAQMVGEEAAMETPPEVLAMLQPQLSAQQQGGIGALPQMEGMTPPPMGGGAPMGGPGGAPAAPQGGMPPMPQGMPPQMPPQMPQGMGGPQGPFPLGGAEAPPTPDGVPPLRAQAGAFVTRAAQLGQAGAQAANQALGRMFMSPQFQTSRMMGPGNFPLTVQGRETLLRDPRTGQIIEGAGTRLAPYTSLSGLQSPTFTEGLRLGARELASQPGTGLGAAGLLSGAAGAYLASDKGNASDYGSREFFQNRADFREFLKDVQAGQLPAVIPRGTPGVDIPVAPPAAQSFPVRDPGTRAAQILETPSMPYAGGPRSTGIGGATAEQMMGEYLRAAEDRGFVPTEEQLRGPAAEAPVAAAAQERLVTPTPPRATAPSRADRIRQEFKDLAPLYKELLGEDKDAAKTQALLLLADAGFRLAGSRAPTMAMAIAEAASGLPAGLSRLAAQAQERGAKINTAALSQAINNVEAQDKEAAALRLAVLKGDYDLLKEAAKKGSGVVLKDGGAGLRVSETKEGSLIGTSIDPNDPTVRTAITSRFTLKPTDNPFVEQVGEAPSAVETDKGERIKLTSTLRSLDNSLKTLENLKGTYSQLYSPGTWFQDKVNNLLVPVSAGVIKPDVNQAEAATRVKVALNSIMKNIASANDGGRVAVQEQEWVRETSQGINDPTAFFSNKEIAASQFNSLETILRNARQSVLTQLGYESNDYVMRTPNTGTQSDPFTIPEDPEKRRSMYTFLGSTIGKLQDPRATVYLRMPNGSVQPFNPSQLRSLTQGQ